MFSKYPAPVYSGHLLKKSGQQNLAVGIKMLGRIDEQAPVQHLVVLNK